MSKGIFCHLQVSDAAGVVIPATVATRAIDAASVVNTSGSDATLTLWQVAASGARSDANILLDAVTVLAGETKRLLPLINHAIASNATIHAQASAATSLTLIVSGRSQ